MGSPRVVEGVLGRLGIHPVLVDVGASIGPPEIWRPIARHSIYVGFDPDSREMDASGPAGFHRSVIVPEAVTCDSSSPRLGFFFTRSPTCSSTLEPDAASLSDYIFADRFAVEKIGSVPAVTLETALARIGLERAHWLKCDTQGLDLRLFESLSPRVRDSVLAFDIEPGLIDAYRGEDLFVEAHRTLTRSGFWLSRLEVHGSVRVRPASLEWLNQRAPRVSVERVERMVRQSPGWVNARYLRTLPALEAAGTGVEDYTLLWAFAALDEQPGFCLDVAIEHGRRFGESELTRVEAEAARRELTGFRWRGLFETARSLSPAWLRRWLKRRIGARFGG